ncbi:tetratricopeptide repeat protein [Bdellovibrio svalbardensis]|uniref:Tetratricopeptide repeat protein n=1 Tax=Bdellovibrio svalbardensis TaxID=2972972 RepID=A0ABT6DFN4_9BACT|nr:tetratricopeptide repeat protein [Bdellovibrio svalbardensis]MDG0815608.1 tetratricopeptide repeat protein [Bdellovibrio svalbardensis]
MLASKQISIIDEVRQPTGRWSYIRESELFMEIVRNIREEQDNSSENTMTQSVAQHTVTKTDAQTASITISDELTPTPFPVMEVKPPAMESHIKDVTPSVERANSRSLATDNAAAKSYGSAADNRVKGKIQKQSNVLRWSLIGIAGLAAVAIVVSLSLKGSKKSAGYEELLKQALRYKSMGLYDKSLAAYKKASAIKEPDSDTQTQMAPVLISEDRQSLQGRRILERALIQDGRTREDLVEAYLGISVSYMMDGDLKEAEDTLQKAIGHEPSNISALLNLAIVQMKKGNYLEAMRDFEVIYRKNANSVLALFGRAMSAMEYAKSTQDRSFLKPLIHDIKTSLQKTGYLRQELTLFLVYAQNLIGDTDGVNQAVIQFLDSEAGLAERYTHPLMVDWRFTQWDYLEKYCSELFEKSIQTAEMKALRSVCLMEVNRDSDAQKMLQEALTEGPKDPYVLAAQASYLNKVNRLPEAMTILKMPELTSLKVRNHLLGDICIASQDLACTEKIFTQVYQDNRNDVAALYGLAWVKMKKKDRAGAYDYVRAGLEAESNYIPMLELRDQLESE